MQKRWIVAALAVGLLLTGCGKKDSEETQPMFEEPMPMLTEAPTWPSSPVLTEAPVPTEGVIETAAPEGAAETVAPPAETTPPETAPKDDPNVEVVDQTVYAISEVNVRSGPGFNHRVIGKLQGGDSVKRTGIGKHGWSRITYEGETAYVANNYVTPDSPETAGGATFQEVNQTVKATAKVNIRKGPGVSYKVLGQLKAGEEVTRTGIGSKGWSRIKYDGNICYVANNYLKVVSNTAIPEETTAEKK